MLAGLLQVFKQALDPSNRVPSRVIVARYRNRALAPSGGLMIRIFL
jgi:hypothetical protein